MIEGFTVALSSNRSIIAKRAYPVKPNVPVGDRPG